MKTFATFAALFCATNAIKTRWAPCRFHLNASGALTGTVGQLTDGQNRVNGPLAPAQFCIADGAITDENGRGCIITRKYNALPTSIFAHIQKHKSPSSNVTAELCPSPASVLAAMELLLTMGQQPSGSGEANIYLTPGGTDCGEVVLKADGCFSGCPSPLPGCPTNLNGAYEYPHLVVPIDSSNPTEAVGTSYFGEVSSSISSIFNFDIPASDSGKTCSLVFLLPTQAQLTTSSFHLSGNGGLACSLLNGVATSTTSFSNAPSVKNDYGVTIIAPGNSYSIATFPCPAGSAISFELKASGDIFLNYFQDFNPSPIGLYITKC